MVSLNSPAGEDSGPLRRKAPSPTHNACLVTTTPRHLCSTLKSHHASRPGRHAPMPRPMTVRLSSHDRSCPGHLPWNPEPTDLKPREGKSISPIREQYQRLLNQRGSPRHTRTGTFGASGGARRTFDKPKVLRRGFPPHSEADCVRLQRLESCTGLNQAVCVMVWSTFAAVPT